MEKIVVASKNPVKIGSVEIGFQRMFPGKEQEFEGVSVPSGVSDQPMSDKETLAGATNRCLNSYAGYPAADYWVGIEGGIVTTGTEMGAYAWIVVKSKDRSGKARTGTFYLPPQVADLVNSGKELGEADDIVFGKSNSKQKDGAVGLLTGGITDRKKLYSEGVILALIPFRNRELY